MTAHLIREQHVSFVIAKRHALAKKLTNVLQSLSTLKSVVATMDQRRDDIIKSTSNESIKAKLIAVDLDGIQKSLGIEESKLLEYHSRFAKDTVNVGVIGLARQGKSQLLRSLSGLDNNTIPTGPYGHCTGARSIFVNNELVEPHGEIHFYTENEFLQEIIAPYYTDLLDSSFLPETIDALEKEQLPLLPDNKQLSVSSKLKYAQLELYKNHIADYKSLLTSTSPLRIPIDRVREFVAQEDEYGQRQFYKSIAVKEARISCIFPQDNVSNIAFIDMPGLGDTGLVTEKWLTKSVSDDLDIILYVKKPSGLGEVWKPQEVGLYDTLKNAQPEIPMELRTFLIMNHVRSSSPNDSNLKNCERLAKEVAEQLKFAGVSIADCSNAEEVNDVIFNDVLSHLIKHIEKIDHLYINNLNSRLRAIHHQIKTELAKASEALGTGESSPLNFTTFNRLFRDTIRRVYTGFEQLINELRIQRDSPDSSFETYVMQSHENAYLDSGIPNLEQIEDTRNLLGGYKSACEYYLNYGRTHLTQHFEGLEEGLSESVESIKVQLATVLSNSDKGRLNGISSSNGSAFLEDILALLGDQYPALDPAFKILLNFKLSYQGFFYYRLRKHLDCLTPDMGMAELSTKPTAQEIHNLLTAMHKMALESLKTEISHWSVEINHAIFAIFEQFVDKVLRSENSMDEWQSFYIENRSQVWPESFQDFFIHTTMRAQWTETINRIDMVNKSILMLEN